MVILQNNHDRMYILAQDVHIKVLQDTKLNRTEACSVLRISGLKHGNAIQHNKRIYWKPERSRRIYYSPNRAYIGSLYVHSTSFSEGRWYSNSVLVIENQSLQSCVMTLICDGLKNALLVFLSPGNLYLVFVIVSLIINKNIYNNTLFHHLFERSGTQPCFARVMKDVIFQEVVQDVPMDSTLNRLEMRKHLPLLAPAIRSLGST